MDISTIPVKDRLYQFEHVQERLCLKNLAEKEAIKIEEVVEEIAANAADEEKFIYVILIFTRLKIMPEKTRVAEYPAAENKTDEDLLGDLLLRLRVGTSE